MPFYASQVTISQINGQDYSSNSSHVFHVGKSRVKLSRGWITKSREIYSGLMQVHSTCPSNISNYKREYGLDLLKLGNIKAPLFPSFFSTY